MANYGSVEQTNVVVIEKESSSCSSSDDEKGKKKEKKKDRKKEKKVCEFDGCENKAKHKCKVRMPFCVSNVGCERKVCYEHLGKKCVVRYLGCCGRRQFACVDHIKQANGVTSYLIYFLGFLIVIAISSSSTAGSR